MIQPSADHDAAERDDQLGPAPRAEPVDDPALDRRQPGLKRDEDAEGDLDEAIDQPCALLIGLTNSVQPYCRLAIITMQMMPAMSCTQRVLTLATGGAPVVVVVVTSSSQCVLSPRRVHIFVLPIAACPSFGRILFYGCVSTTRVCWSGLRPNDVGTFFHARLCAAPFV